MSQNNIEEGQKKAAEEKRERDKAAEKAQLLSGLAMQPVSKTSSDNCESSAELTYFKATPNAQWKIILEDYKKFCQENKINPDQQSAEILIFNTIEEAERFFEAQAKLNRSFICVQIDSTGAPKDYHVFSCGNGKLYKCKAQDIRNELAKDGNKDALERFNSFNPPNPTHSLRNEMKKAKEEPAASPAASDNLKPY